METYDALRAKGFGTLILTKAPNLTTFQVVRLVTERGGARRPGEVVLSTDLPADPDGGEEDARLVRVTIEMATAAFLAGLEVEEARTRKARRSFEEAMEDTSTPTEHAARKRKGTSK